MSITGFFFTHLRFVGSSPPTSETGDEKSPVGIRFQCFLVFVGWCSWIWTTLNIHLWDKKRYWAWKGREIYLGFSHWWKSKMIRIWSLFTGKAMEVMAKLENPQQMWCRSLPGVMGVIQKYGTWHEEHIAGGWFFALPLWKNHWVKVSWDDFPFPTECKVIIQSCSSHHQPD